MTAEIIICPDCGQRYDPAKAAKVERAWSESTRRLIKPGRVEAQDVSAAGHRRGYHHQAHCEATRAALDGMVPFLFAPIVGRRNEHTPLMDLLRDVSWQPTAIWRSPLGVIYGARHEEIDSIAVEIEEPRWRAHVERAARAASVVREDHPWWRAYLHELGVSPDVIALGLTVGVADRGDVLFRRRVPQVGPTLRGLL